MKIILEDLQIKASSLLGRYVIDRRVAGISYYQYREMWI